MYIYPTADDYGYYTVGHNYKTYSKWDAIQEGIRRNFFPQWHFNDDVYSMYDWTKEPVESLDFLYQERAIQLRNAYDYVILMYSGGWDSSHTLQSFINAGVFPDEVFSFYSGREKDSLLAQEINNYTIPKLEFIKQKYPKIKVRSFDYSEFLIKEAPTLMNPLHDDYIFMYDNYMFPNKIFQDHIISCIADWKNLVDSGKRVALVYGIDKPLMRYCQGKWIAWFMDVAQSEITTYLQYYGTYGEYRELFYWSPNAPKIPIKQAHQVMNYYKNDISIINHPESKSEFGHRISRHKITDIIYPSVNTQKFYTQKPPIHAWGGRDWNFLKDNSFEISQQYWKAIDYIDKILDPSWVNDEKYSKSGAKGQIVNYYLN